MAETIRFRIGRRIYELVPYPDNLPGDFVAHEAEMLGAKLGKRDGQFILKHQKEIPSECREFFLVFADWRDPTWSYIATTHCLRGECGLEWKLVWSLVDHYWRGPGRLVRRVS